jgi:hypothetical protein
LIIPGKKGGKKCPEKTGVSSDNDDLLPVEIPKAKRIKKAGV